MAYAVLSSLAQTIHQILDNDQFPISNNGKHQISSLREHAVFLQEFLEKFPKEANSLEIRIRDAANEAEDNLEHFMYDQIRSHHNSIRSNPFGFHELKKLIQKIYDQIWSRYDFDELKEVMEEINSISREAADVKSLNRTETVAIGDTPTVRSVPSSLSTLAPTVGGVTVGLDDDLMKIKDLLCGESSKLQIIPIVGMGGIGKTTLARKAYHDPLIMESFWIRAWVTVSQDYKAQNIFSDLLHFCKEVGDERSGKSNDFMQDKVYKFLKGRKYLIVLDDIWSTKAWDDVKKIFPDDRNGSRIVLTTRIEDVASYADSSNYLHRMRFMDLDQSLNLLKQKVFPNKDCPSELEYIGKDIARSCGGLPLAIVLVAGILSTVDETRFLWLEVAKKVRLAVDGEAGHFEKIISLSYTHLPHHLRPCFLYMGGFPEDFEIRVSKLIKLWIAEGFVEPRGGKSLEEGAEEYLEDLVKRSLALVAKRKSNGKIKSCNVHDLVRDICKRKAEEEGFQRRLSIAHPDLMFLARTYGSTLRSVICFQPSESSLGALKVFRLLRVLDVVDADVYSFPAQVFDLFHLRYLAFSCRPTLEIPAAISRLQNLRTLIICDRNSMGVMCLPFEIWMMPLLTHLVSSCPLVLNTEGVASTLEKLATLSVVRRFVCTKKMIEMIPNITKLGITYFDDEEDLQLHNLVLLRQLEKLKLVCYAFWLKVNPVFPETLKKLTLCGWRLPWGYMETVGSLPNLQVLKLRNHACLGRTWETNEEQFPSLELLYIDESNLKNWVTEKSHFPRLKRLVLFRCSQLSEIPDDIGEIPTLELIEVDRANKALVECAKRIQAEQHDNGNYGLQLHCVYTLKRIVVQVTLKSEIHRRQALKIVAGKAGVHKVSAGEDRLVITGDDIDLVGIVYSLSEEIGLTNVVSVEDQFED